MRIDCPLVRCFAVSLIASLALGVPPSVFAQAPVRDRDPVRVPAGGHRASIAGQVTIGGTGRPARRTTVHLVSDTDEKPRLAMTNDAGEFRFTDVPPGRFQLSATRPGFVDAFFGSSQPGQGPGTPIAVAPGAELSGIDMELTKGAVLAGRVFDEYGLPMADMPIELIDRRTLNGPDAGAPMSMRSVSTSDRGEFRFYGLPPGEYLLVARPSRWPPAATVSPTPRYYPGTPDIEAATAIRLAASEEQTALTLQMSYAR